MKLTKTFILLTILLYYNALALAQGNPAHFSVQQKQVSPTEIDVVFSGKIDEGWHVYSTGLATGPISATLHTEKAEGAKAVGSLKAQGHEINIYDNMFGMKLRYFENSVKFIQRYKITGKTYSIKGYLEYGICNDEMCMPPSQVEFSYTGKGVEETEKAEEEAATVEEESVPIAGKDSIKTENTDSVSADTTIINAASDLWQPVIKELGELDKTSTNNSLWYIFIMGLLGGLLALFTPCVWPIIPMTVSFFLKRAKDKSKGLRDAITYGISIIVIYLSLGLLITGFSDSNALNALATNAYFNIFFCLLLIVFALSFFGWFELALPSSWANKVDNKASNTSGLLSIFLMAFTLSLVSFSCTGPIIGFLLVDFATSGDLAAPAIGMLGFAIALALPFTLFALFPSWLKQAPKSGSWMNIIKISLGFIELAFACKFFSVADLAYGWHLMDREVFLSIWIVVFTALGLYLIGIMRFQSDGEDRKPMPVPCIMLGLISLAFSVYMIPGLWGAPCKAISAFAPPINTQDFNLNKAGEIHPAFTSYEEGMKEAAKQGKPVMIDFTGFGCVNCRKMEAAVWTDPQVAERLTKDYVLISLYVDDKTPLKQPMEVKRADGSKRILRTVGDKWSYLEETKFGYLAQPFYVTLDNEGKPLSGSFIYKEDIPGYLEFLNKGLENYRK